MMVAPHGQSSFRTEDRESQKEEEERESAANDNATHPFNPSSTNALPTNSPQSQPIFQLRVRKGGSHRRISPLLRWIRLLLFAASIGRVASTNIEVQELSESTYANQTSGLALVASGESEFFVPVIPLTSEVGFGKDEEFLKTIDLSGKLDLYTSDKRGVSLKDSNSIAYLNCEGTSDGHNSTALFQSVVQLKFAAVVLYTTTKDHYCILTGGLSPLPVFTSISPSSASKAFSHLDTSIFLPAVHIKYYTEYKESSATKGQSNTAAVALFVLYAFTGVLGTFFISVLTVGTIRAHRHPERYGRRDTAMHGRPRQSRAKGLARAVLDTIPIVHFNIAGNVENNHYPVIDRKPGDIEMARSASQRALTDQSAPASRAETLNSNASILHNYQRPLTIHEADAITETPSPLHTPPSPANAVEKELGGPVTVLQNQCPVCQENFEKGQQLRVLPCRHGFHQACIDPWLLNSSGSCPLCRIDLRPEDARKSFQMPPPPAPGVIPPNSRGRSAVPELGISRLAAYIRRQRRARQAGGARGESPNVPEEAARV